MIERFCLFLHYNNERGKVTVEGTNPSENTQFKKAFNELCASGTTFIPAARVKHMIGHTPLTVTRKRDDIMGVQLADFLCQPTMEACLKRFRKRGTTKPFHKAPHARRLAKALPEQVQSPQRRWASAETLKENTLPTRGAQPKL